MSPKKDFNDKAGLSDEQIIARLVAAQSLVNSMDEATRSLYMQVASTGIFDPNAMTQTFTVPANADRKAMKSILKMLDVSQDPAVKVLLVQEMPRDAAIVEKLTRKARKDSAKPQP